MLSAYSSLFPYDQFTVNTVKPGLNPGELSLVLISVAAAAADELDFDGALVDQVAVAAAPELE